MDRRLWIWGPVVVYAVMIIGVSSIPGSSLSVDWIWSWDKLLHACEYSVLGALLARALCMRLAPWVAFPLAVICAAAFGACDEWYQTSVPGRTGTPFDAVADLVGATLGALSVTLWRQRKVSHGDRS